MSILSFFQKITNGVVFRLLYLVWTCLPHRHIEGFTEDGVGVPREAAIIVAVPFFVVALLVVV